MQGGVFTETPADIISTRRLFLDQHLEYRFFDLERENLEILTDYGVNLALNRCHLERKHSDPMITKHWLLPNLSYSKKKSYQLARPGDSNDFFLQIFDVHERGLKFLENQYIIIIKQHITTAMDPPNHQSRIEPLLDNNFAFLDQITSIPSATLEAQIIPFHKFLVLEAINLFKEFIVATTSDPPKDILDKTNFFLPAVFK